MPTAYEAPPARPRPMIGAAAAALAIVAVLGYAELGRPWMDGWGATPAEAARFLPGDEAVPFARLVTTRAVTIDAPPAAVWPWLAQIGTRRAGWYSYDWLDNGGRPSATRLLAPYQDLRPGDVIPVLPDGSFGFPVLAAEPGRRLTVGGSPDPGFSAVWTLWLDPVDATHTRLVARLRMDAPGLRGWVMAAALGPASFVMERKMLLNLKWRAEHGPEPVPGAAPMPEGGPS